VTVKGNDGAKEELDVVDTSHFELEDQLLHEYLEKYGEHPPLND
jgi:hypothetical protein